MRKKREERGRTHTCTRIDTQAHAEARGHRVASVHDLAVGRPVGTLLDLRVVELEKIVEPGEQLVFAHEEGRIHHADARHVAWPSSSLCYVTARSAPTPLSAQPSSAVQISPNSKTKILFNAPFLFVCLSARFLPLFLPPLAGLPSPNLALKERKRWGAATYEAWCAA